MRCPFTGVNPQVVANQAHLWLSTVLPPEKVQLLPPDSFMIDVSLKISEDSLRDVRISHKGYGGTSKVASFLEADAMLVVGIQFWLQGEGSCFWVSPSSPDILRRVAPAFASDMTLADLLGFTREVEEAPTGDTKAAKSVISSVLSMAQIEALAYPYWTKEILKGGDLIDVANPYDPNAVGRIMKFIKAKQAEAVDPELYEP